MIQGGKQNGSTDFFNTLSNPTLVAKDVLYVTQTLIGDAFVTYRLFMVWNRSWPIVVFPILLLLGAASASSVLLSPHSARSVLTDVNDLVAGYGACVEIGLVEGYGIIFATNIAPWGKAFFIISLTTNVFATGECRSRRIRATDVL